jgi:CheY-like chemotaxis protein
VLAAFLNRKKFLFDEACNGQEGLEAFERQPSGYYDVILMDL